MTSDASASVALAFRSATADDLPPILTTVQAAFPVWPPFEVPVSPLDHLRWKMELPPGVPSTHVVGTVEGEPVAFALRWGWRVIAGGQERLANASADLAIRPEHQGQGYGVQLSTRALEAARAHSAFGFGPPSRNVRVPRIYQNVNPEQASHPVRIWTRPFTPRGFVAAHLQGGGPRHLLSSLARWAGTPRSLLAAPGDPGGDIRIEELDRFDARTDALWKAAKAGFDFAVIRDADYLNWRYRDPAGGETLVLSAVDRSEEHVLGFVVLKRTRDWANVVDLLIHPDHPEVASELLLAGLERLRAAGCRGVNCWLPPGHPNEAALRATRFLEMGRGTAVSFWAIGDESSLEALKAPSPRLHITVGDFDFV